MLSRQISLSRPIVQGKGKKMLSNKLVIFGPECAFPIPIGNINYTNLLNHIMLKPEPNIF
jgi:hypothetical protein